MKWEMYLENRDQYYKCQSNIDGIVYSLIIYPEELSKSIRFWVGASSGKKRKDLDIFVEKPNQVSSGIKGLIWMKKAIIEFPNYFNSIPYRNDKKQMICIKWEDNKRRNVYSRLLRYGFEFSTVDGQKCLTWKTRNY